MRGSFRFEFICLFAFVLVAAVRPACASDNSDAQTQAAFEKAVKAYQQKDFASAETLLNNVPELGGYLSLYKHWFLGRTELELGHYAEAETEFLQVIEGHPSLELKRQSQFYLGEVAFRQKKYAEVIKRLTALERRWHHSYRAAQVLWRLAFADLKLHRVRNACREARKLYSLYPADVLISDWGTHLRDDSIEDHKLPCQESDDDFQTRVRRLQLAGDGEKAHNEITQRLAVTKPEDRLKLDMVLAEFLVNDGVVDEALNLLIHYYPTQKTNRDYLMLLAKAASRAGDYQTADKALARAYQLDPHSRDGRQALFQQAYLSYEFQDYDGAARKFKAFVTRYPRSGLARNSEWYLAWLQYLRNDFKGAIAQFDQVRHLLRRHGRLSHSFRDRLDYWTAMAHLRLKEYSDAGEGFNAVIARDPYSYYGLAAAARLETIKSKLPAEPRVPAGLRLMPIGNEYDIQPSAASDDQESDEDVTQADSENPGAPAIDDGAADAGDDDQPIQASDFKDPRLRARIQVAKNLIDMGLSDLARWELYEVERHTRNPVYLRMLITAYESIGSYNRSASIAQLDFWQARHQAGMEGARDLWLSMYPQAYDDQVEAAAKKFSVPKEWIWAIMRTESVYKPDVSSPVGAKGLMQLMPITAQNLCRLSGEDPADAADLVNPNINIQLGTQYLARLMQMFKGQLPLVAAAYNAGPHRVDGWLVSFGNLDMDEFVEHIPFLETRNYVKKVIRSDTFYRRLYAQDQKAVAYLAHGLGVPIPSHVPVRESWEAL